MLSGTNFCNKDELRWLKAKNTISTIINDTLNVKLRFLRPHTVVRCGGPFPQRLPSSHRASEQVGWSWLGAPRGAWSRFLTSLARVPVHKKGREINYALILRQEGLLVPIKPLSVFFCPFKKIVSRKWQLRPLVN